MQILISLSIAIFSALILWFVFWKPAISVPPGRKITGRIDALGEFDVSGFDIYLASMDTSAGEIVISRVHDSGGVPIEAVTGPGGTFELRGVPDGVFWVAFKKKGYNTRMRLVKVQRADAETVLIFK